MPLVVTTVGAALVLFGTGLVAAEVVDAAVVVAELRVGVESPQAAKNKLSSNNNITNNLIKDGNNFFKILYYSFRTQYSL
jgi:hypothetical protein